MRTLDPNDGRSPYLVVADAIRDAINAGEWTSGQRLPSRIKLTKHFGVSPMTVQNALRVLRDEGLIVSRQGSGVFVHTDAPPRADVHAELAELRARVEQLEETVRALTGQQP
jgi:DNA-binding GntR family transcriptional regulator